MHINKKVAHHVRKSKERLVVHIKKHQKKYIFWTWIGVGIGILEVLLVVGAFLGINMIMGRTTSTNEKLKIYQALETMIRIDDLAHKEIQKWVQESQFTEEDKKKFFEIDRRYHNAENIHKKYIVARDMVDLLKQIKEYENTETTGEEDNKLRELLFLFYTIK